MALEPKRLSPVALRKVGFDEKWLQDRINDDPGILGLGDDVEIVGREHRQPVGGRIDFLLRDAEGEIYYEVEVMLGALDESHIIRTIEYWDIERQRRPMFEHTAVIVAEQITARFFNVLRLLNRSVPIIAVQLSAFIVGENIVLHPVIVLNVIEEITDIDPPEGSPVDRAYWEKKSSPASLAVMDKIASLLSSDTPREPRITYNRTYIVLRNFCTFRPRKGVHCRIVFRAATEDRDSIVSELQNAGIEASPRSTNRVAFNITLKEVEDNAALIQKVIKEH
jgi:hypothetical protein